VSQILLYRKILFIIIGCTTFLSAIVHKPKNNGEKIKLEIRGKERIYHELDQGLIYKNIGKKFNANDSIKICIHTRTIKAPTGKKNRNYGFKVQINDRDPFELKYKKGGSGVKSPDRPGWDYTQSGKWFIYLPVNEKKYSIKIEPLKGNPVVYVRLTSNLIQNKGSWGNIIHTVNRQERAKIITEGKKNPKKWYTIHDLSQQQFEIKGPSKIRAFSRIEYPNENAKEEYYLFVREDGIDLGTYYFVTEKSTMSSIVGSNESVSKWRSLWLNVPEGKHYYTFSIPNTELSNNKTIFIRLKEWKEE